MIKYVFFIFFISTVSFAQSIEGEVKGINNEPIVDCLVTIKQNNSIIDFVKTNELGYFKIEELENSEYEIEFNHENFIIKKIKVKPSNDKIKLVLEEKVFHEKSIQEIVVKKENSIVVKKDTVVFDVKSLKKVGDNVLEDLLKRLPEVTVDKNGSVFYKGKEIKSLMIDGDDLFKDKYVIGSKNLNLDIVEKIEAIENYNSNEVTRGIQKSNEVAINLKSNKAIKYNLTSDIKSDYYKEYEASLFGLLLKKNKAYIYFNKNNIGKVQNDDINKFLIQNNFQELVLENSFFDYNNSVYYNYFNNQNVITSNYLLKYKKKIGNNIGFSFKNDILNKNNTQSIEYFNESDNYYSKSFIKSKPTNFNFNNDFDVNFNSKLSFQNFTKVLKEELNQLNEEYRNGVFFYRNDEFNKLGLYNSMSFSYKVSKKIAISAKYSLYKSNLNQSFYNNLLTSETNFQSNYILKNDLNKASLFLFYFDENNNWVSYDLNYVSNKYLLNSYQNSLESVNNTLKYFRKFSKMKLDLSLNLSNYLSPKLNSNFFVLPEARIAYNITKKWSLTNFFTSKIKELNALSLFTSQIVTYSDNVFNYDNVNLFTKYSNCITLSYLDIFNTRSIAFSLTKGYQTGDIYLYNKFTNNSFTRNYQFVNRSNNNIAIEIDAKNYFYFLKTTISLKYSYDKSNTYYFNLNVLKPVQNEQNNFIINFQKEIFKKVFFTENFNYCIYKAKTEINTNEFKSLQNNLISKYQLTDKIYMSVDYIQILPDLSQKDIYHFVNSTLSYKFKNRLELNFTGINLFNNKTIYINNQTSYSNSVIENSIHTRTMLLGLKYVL